MQKNEWKTDELQYILEHDQSKKNTLPYTYIALYNGNIVGSCSLEEKNPLEEDPEVDEGVVDFSPLLDLPLGFLPFFPSFLAPIFFISPFKTLLKVLTTLFFFVIEQRKN